MPLIFPPVDHVPLQRPPLKEVICQVRFPPILKIAEQPPSDFQEAIRERFPNYDTRYEVNFQVAPGQPPQNVGVKPPTHFFLDRHKSRRVSLGMNFFALSTDDYHGWDDFADDLQYVADAVLSVYRVPYAVRTGLRYINGLTVENTGVEEFNPGVLNLIRSELTALVRTQVMQLPISTVTTIRANQEHGEFTIRVGIVQEADQPNIDVFLLDFDRYTQENTELESGQLLALCETYHAEIYNAFRWCVEEEALTRFGVSH